MMNNAIINTKEAGYMMTQYETAGTCGRDEFIQYYMDEELYVTIDMLPEYNEYLSENYYETYMDIEELEMSLENVAPLNIIQMTYYGKFNFADDYFRYNGYGNIDSFSEYQVVNEMKEDEEFKKWYIENYVHIDEDDINEAIKNCNNLLKMGF